MNITRRTTLVALAGMCTLFASGAHAADAARYPEKPIRMIVPFGAGTTADIIARLVGESIGRDLGTTVVAENRPGAAGTIGASLVAREPNDGYTLVLGTIASHGIGTLMFPSAKYDPVKDFEPITLIANVPNMLVVNKNVPVNTAQEFLAYAKRAEKPVHFSSPGTATTSHLAGELLRLELGANLSHVAYRSGATALTDVVAGEVPAMIWQVTPLKPHLDSGAIKAIAAMSAKRIPAYPDIPTIGETLLPGFDSNAWFGVLAPAGTPDPIVRKLHAAILKAMETPQLHKQFEAQGLEPAGDGPEAFKAIIERDLVKWRDVVEKAGVKVQ